VVIEDLISKAGKTADLAKLLTKIGAERNVVIVVEQKDAGTRCGPPGTCRTVATLVSAQLY
jgi:ribosomal protein L4